MRFIVCFHRKKKVDKSNGQQAGCTSLRLLSVTPEVPPKRHALGLEHSYPVQMLSLAALSASKEGR
jgi:hypothetical protein